MGVNNNGNMTNAANPNRSVEDNPTDMLSSRDFTMVKFVPYSAADRRRRSRAFQTSLRMGVDGGCCMGDVIEAGVLLSSTLLGADGMSVSSGCLRSN